MQAPPAFSAIKVDGDRAYDLARAGETVELEARPVQIDALDAASSMPDRDTAVFEARCGKGTYVRALARDMGRALGCLGHVIALRRTRVAAFDEAAGGHAWRRCEAAAEAGEDALHAPAAAGRGRAAATWPMLSVGQNDAARLLRGQPVLIRGRDAPIVAGADLRHLQGPADRRRPHREGRAAARPACSISA